MTMDFPGRQKDVSLRKGQLLSLKKGQVNRKITLSREHRV